MSPILKSGSRPAASRPGSPNWADRFIGLPFKKRGRDWAGCDCWGLHRLICGEIAGIYVPAFSTVAEAQRHGSWIEVTDGSRQAFDAVLMRGDPCHVGTMIDGRRLIHVEKDSMGAVCVALSDIAIRGRVLSVWRHESLL